MNREQQAIVEAFLGGLVVPREALGILYDLACKSDPFEERQVAALAAVRQILDFDQDARIHGYEA